MDDPKDVLSAHRDTLERDLLVTRERIRNGEADLMRLRQLELQLTGGIVTVGALLGKLDAPVEPPPAASLPPPSANGAEPPE